MRGWALSLCLADWGTGERGALLELTVVGLGQDKVLYKDPAAAREGSGKPLPWPFGPHVAVYKYKITHTHTQRIVVTNTI